MKFLIVWLFDLKKFVVAWSQSGINLEIKKKWFAPETFVQIKDSKEKRATASTYMLVCKPGSAKILPAKL